MRPLSREQVSQALMPQKTFGLVGPDIPMVFTDTRRPVPGALFVALVGENFDAHNHLQEALDGGAAGLVISKDEALPSDLPPQTFVVVVDDTQQALTRIAELVRQAHPGRFAAVTGSVGKTTVKDMLAAALVESGGAAASPGNWNNEIGLPLSLFATGGDEPFVVLELGMSAPGEIDALTRVAKPEVGVVTAAAAAHLEFFDSVDAIADAKAELYRALPDGARAVACADDPRILKRAQEIRPDGLLTYGLSASAHFRVFDITQSAEGLKAQVACPEGEVVIQVQGLGVHNAVNAAGALAAASLLGVSPSDAAASLSAHFKPAAHRLQIHKTPSKAFVLDDAYNANPMSAKAALDTLAAIGNQACGLGAVLGSMLELGADADLLHEEVGRHAAELGLVWLVAAGIHAEALARGARLGGVPNVHIVNDAMEASKMACDFASDGRWLLLKGSRGGRLERLLTPLGLEEVN